MRIKIIRHTFQMLALLTCLGMTSASAQNFGGLLKGIIQAKTGLQAQSGDLLDVIKSVSDVSFGQIVGGAQAPQDAAGKVILYRTSWCGYCKRAAAYMQQKNIPFVERDIETNSAYKAEYRLLGGTGPVPFMVFGRKTMLGFAPEAVDQNYAEFQRTQAAANSPSVNPPVTPNQTVHAGVGLQAGDALIGKIPGVQVYVRASKTSPRLLALGKGEEVIYMGEEREGFFRVTSPQGEGWIDKLLAKKP
ncbi:MAG TPA: glutaredoxin domain-containing protein [Noviherbaspirillum sp.]|nr:glutaredoxin domain-containing protein [Noviherbaspirillum sp.]